MFFKSVLALFVFVLSFTVNAAVKINHWQTSTGSEVYFVENHDLPIIDMSVNFPAGSARDTKATSGAVSYTHLDVYKRQTLL